MKKIVGILAAAAILATSAFAADVSAKAKIDGSLFNWDGSNVTALSIKHGNENWNPNVALSVSGDKAGAAFKFYDTTLDGTNYTNVTTGYSVWFKPVDVLKVTVGSFGTNLNQEHIGWCHTESGIDTYGYTLSYASGAISADLMLAPGWDTKWYTKDSVAETYFKFAYNADFGTIDAMFDGASNFTTMKFGAGYKGTAGSVGYWVNALGFYTNNEFAKVRAEADIATSLGPVAWELFIAGGYNMGKGWYDPSWWRVGSCGKPETAFCGFYTKFTMPVSVASAFMEIKCVDVLASPFAIEVKPGVDVNVGTCAIEVAADVNIGSAVTVDIPVSFTVNF